MSERPVLLAAGGTGGHLFPAESLAVALARRGLPVELVTDDRAIRYGGGFPARAIHTIASATPRGGSLIAKGLAALTLARGVIGSLGLLRRVRPLCVVGFGGYPTVPPLLAAALLRMPCMLHDQNAVLGELVVAEVALGPRSIVQEVRETCGEIDRLQEANRLGRLQSTFARGDGRVVEGEGNVGVEIHRHRHTATVRRVSIRRVSSCDGQGATEAFCCACRAARAHQQRH
jgi:hypothetical protein